MASCGNSNKFLQAEALRVSVVMHYLFPVWCERTLSLAFHVCWIQRISDLLHRIPCIARHCSLLSHLTHSRLPVINGIDVRCWNVFWPMSTADSREYRLLPSNTTRPNMHKTNTGLQAPAAGANYLCNKKADTFLMWLQRLSIISCLM